MSNGSARFMGLFLLTALGYYNAVAQPISKLVAECTITYSVTLEGDKKNENTVKKLFIKGRKTRSEISNSSFYQATIFDNKTGNAVVLKHVGGDKYISSFTADQWKEKNGKWMDVKVTLTDETATIAGYNCRKAIITTKTNENFIVYYTIALLASATENPYEFKDIPGLILQYSSKTENGNEIVFKATDINFSPVTASKFEIPSTGYRII